MVHVLESQQLRPGDEEGLKHFFFFVSFFCERVSDFVLIFVVVYFSCDFVL